MTVVALVACNAAGADPTAPPTGGPAHPARWKQLPAMVTAVGAAARADGVVVDSVDAWGQPAIGCYAVWLALRGGAGDARPLADQILDGLARVGRPSEAAERGARPSRRDEAIAISDVAMPTGVQGVLAFAFARPPYRGRARAQLGNGRIALTACFANQREPGACDAPCESVLRGVP